MQKHVVRYEVISRSITQRREAQDQHSVKLLYKGDGTHWLHAQPSLEVRVPPEFAARCGDYIKVTLEVS